jgi:TIR domain-containing protein
MRIFLSWSGHESHEMAVAIRDWLPTVLPFAEPWISSEDIDKGARWANEIGVQLDEASFGIICIVPGNLDQPWLNFEAGAISKSLEAGRVAPLLVGVNRHEVVGPLAQFQLTDFDREDMLRLVCSINSASEQPVADDRVSKNFDLCWRGLEEAITSIDISSIPNSESDSNTTTESAGLDEPQTKTLLFLANHDGQDFPAEQLAHQANLNLTRMKHTLKQLDELGFVYVHLNMLTGTSYAISDGGREYLVERDLI